MADRPALYDAWISQTVREAAEREGSFNALEAAIARASEGLRALVKPSRARFDRRKLKLIGEGEPGVAVTFDELLMLDAYLAPLGKSLTRQPILERPGPLQLIAGSPRVEFLLGARIDGVSKRTTMADRDVLAMMELQDDIGRHSHLTRIGFQDVIVRDSLDDTRQELDQLFAWLKSTRARALIGVASSRVNSAVERMLAGMAMVTEYQATEAGDVPFHFVWPTSDSPAAWSAFELRPDQIPDRFRKARDAVDEGARALIWADGVCLAEPADWDDSRDVGVICVQRRSNGQIWLVVAGLSGAGTVAAAKMVRHMDVWIPKPSSRRRHGDMFWAVVETKARHDRPETVMAIREQMDMKSSFLVPPQRWRPAGEDRAR